MILFTRIIAIAMALALFSSQVYARSRKSSFRNSTVHAIDEALVKTPVPDETCFAPDDPCDIKLEKFIQSATKSIDIAIFDINLDKLVHDILVQTKRIPVRLVVDRREAKSKGSLVSLLVKAGAHVKLGHQRGIMHNKFVVVDNKIIETGSFNYTNGAAFKNNENQVYLATPAIVERYRERFEKLWADGDDIK